VLDTFDLPCKCGITPITVNSYSALASILPTWPKQLFDPNQSTGDKVETRTSWQILANCL